MSPHYICVVTTHQPLRVYDCFTLDDARKSARDIVAWDRVGTYVQIYAGRKDEGRDADPVEVIEGQSAAACNGAER